MSRAGFPPLRLRTLNEQKHRPKRDYVLYWMTASRRPTHNFALQRAAELAVEYDKPLVILEALRCGYRWASRRHHHFIMQGMADNAAWFAKRDVSYYPYVEPHQGAGAGLLAALGKRACVVVGDDYPCFFLPRMLQAAAEQLDVALEAVDSNGLLPMRAATKMFFRAYDLRRYLQKNLAPHLEDMPRVDPLARRKLPKATIAKKIYSRWPMAEQEALANGSLLDGLPIDQDVLEVKTQGGFRAGSKRLKAFVDTQLPRYHEDRSHPDDDVASGLSPYLHYGHVGAHQAFSAVAQNEQWSLELLAPKATGARAGWWGMSEAAESFLDELVTWREVGFNACTFEPRYAHFDSLPNWAKISLAEHAADPRPQLYTLKQFEKAETHDEIWNAAQRQLVVDGRMQNYLRMLWGKKILHWSDNPGDALDIMIELNNKYALDGRDPNSYSGIFWVLGRYDRAWGPEREVFGKIRYMTSDSTRRKLRLKKYLARWSDAAKQGQLAL